MKYCTQCGSEIAKTNAKFCSNCGIQITTDNSLNTESISSKTRRKKTLKRNILLIISIAIVLTTLFIIVLNNKDEIIPSKFSADEQYGLNMVEKYQDILKNPESLILRSDIAVVTFKRDGQTYKYVFFNASGENSYGASITSTPCFVNGKYICNTDEIPTVTEYMDMSDSESKVYLGIELALATWNLYGEDAKNEKEDVVDSYSVSAKKIAKKLDVNYKIN